MESRTSSGLLTGISDVVFELAFVGGFSSVRDGIGVIDADLSSQELDKDMHSGGALRVRLGSCPAGPPGGPGFVLDSFELASIAAYLSGQQYVRRTLETELMNELPSDGATGGSASAIWEHATVLYLSINPRNVRSAESIAELRKRNPKMAEKILAAGDKPDTKSTFTLVLKVAWDSEHWRLALFRDGFFQKWSWE